MGNQNDKEFLRCEFKSDSQNFPQQILCQAEVITQQSDDSGLFDNDVKNTSSVLQTYILSTNGYFARYGLGTTFYESNKQKKQFQVKSKPCYIYLIFIDQLLLIDLLIILQKPDTNALIKIKQTNQGLIVSEGIMSDTFDSGLWMVLKKQHTTLRIGDQFKIGRIRFRVVELSTQKQYIQTPEVFPKYQSVKKYSSQQVCRVCLSNDNNSPLIRPCNCDGSVAYIHVCCLKDWFSNKIKANETGKKGSVIYYAWKNLECEICKKQYQYTIHVDGIKVQLFEMCKPEGPYMILESLTRDRSQLKGLFLLDFTQKNPIKIGRGHEIDMRILDISVSRCHGMLYFEKDEFKLSDCESKFGSLVYMKDQVNICLPQYRQCTFQVDQVQIKLSVKMKSENLFACLGSKPKQKTKIQKKDDGQTTLQNIYIQAITQQYQPEIYSGQNNLDRGLLQDLSGTGILQLNPEDRYFEDLKELNEDSKQSDPPDNQIQIQFSFNQPVQKKSNDTFQITDGGLLHESLQIIEDDSPLCIKRSSLGENLKQTEQTGQTRSTNIHQTDKQTISSQSSIEKKTNNNNKHQQRIPAQSKSDTYLAYNQFDLQALDLSKSEQQLNELDENDCDNYLRYSNFQQ